MKAFGWTVLIVAGVICLSVVGCALGWLGRAADVVQREVDPSVLQQKYEWFKDASATLDARMADIAVYDKRQASANCSATTDRVSREQCMVWIQEESGITASYNELAAQYNSEMAKWNWRFANVGQLPQGSDTPLPREYKPYQSH